MKKHGAFTDNRPIRKYISNIENKITFRIQTRYYFKLSTPETMKFLRSTKSKIIKNKNGEIVPHLEINKVVLVHCDVVNNDYQHH